MAKKCQKNVKKWQKNVNKMSTKCQKNVKKMSTKCQTNKSKKTSPKKQVQKKDGLIRVIDSGDPGNPRDRVIRAIPQSGDWVIVEGTLDLSPHSIGVQKSL